MSDTGNALTKVLESETGKFISGKLFGRLEKALLNNTRENEAKQALDTISSIRPDEREIIFDKVTDRYLKFRTLLSRDRDVFIDKIYHPLRLRNLSTKSKEVVTLNEQFVLELPKVTCIIGKAGQGKTTILRKVFINYLSSDCGKFPLIITLRKIDWEDKSLTPPKVVSQEFHSLGISVSEEACSFLLQLGRLRILYDGFDEVEIKSRQAALGLITETHTTFGSNCIVTTRPGTDITYYGGYVTNYELMDLEFDDVLHIITNNDLISKQDKAQLVEVIKSKKDITSILLTPIIVDIFISTYHMLEAEPDNVIDVYQQLFQALASTHDKLKVQFERGGKSGLKNTELQKVFQTASYSLLLKQKSEITFKNIELIEAFDHASNVLGFKKLYTYQDVIDKTSLIKQEGNDYSYLHKSILEFFAAKHIKGLSDDTRKEYYEYILKNYSSKHENVLRFLRVIDDELFHITFVKKLINLLKETSASLFEKGGYKINNDVLNVCLRTDCCIVVKDIIGGLTRVMVEDGKQQINVRNMYRDILESVLDISTGAIAKDPLTIALNELHRAGKDVTLGTEPSTKEVNTQGELTKQTHKVKIMDLIDFEEKSSSEFVNRDELVKLYDGVYLLNEEVERKQRIYDEKNILSTFY
jgi:hypothetical protein